METPEIPEQFKGRVDYGRYGGKVQFFIVGVDGTCAQLGETLPDPERLEQRIQRSHESHRKLVADHEKQR